MTVKMPLMETTSLKITMIVKNSLNRRNTLNSVFNKILQSDIGKTIVRKHTSTLDEHSVWRDFESDMSTSSKGLNERNRLHTYVSTTIYDKSWKGTTEQFVLHFYEQFRQLDEVTPLNEHLLPSVSLTLLQTAVD